MTRRYFKITDAFSLRGDFELDENPSEVFRDKSRFRPFLIISVLRRSYGPAKYRIDPVFIYISEDDNGEESGALTISENLLVSNEGGERRKV